MANTTYKASIKPQFSGVQAQDVSYDLSQPKQMLGDMAKAVEQEAKTLQNIAQDESQIAFNQGAAELVQKYGTDYKGLNDALLELEKANYDKFSPNNKELAMDLYRQQDAVRLRAVDAARKQYIKVNNDKIKASSGMLLDSFKMAMPDDFANYLYQKTLPEEEQDIDVIGQWENNIAQMDMLLNRRDMEGNYIFSETDRKNRANLNSYKMQGAKTFISGMESEQLKKWDENTFQNEKAFREMTGFDKDDYDKLNTYVKNRRKELDAEDKRVVKTQAAFNLADVLGRGNADAKLDALREEGVLPEKLIKKVEDLDKKAITSRWYDPDKESDPMGLINAISELGNEVSKDEDYSPDGMLKKIEKSTDILERAYDNREKTNMSDDDFAVFRNMVQKATTDQTFNHRWMLDLTNWTDEIKLDMYKHPELHKKGALEDYYKEEETARKAGKLTRAESDIAKRVTGYNYMESLFSPNLRTMAAAQKRALIGASKDIYEIEKQIELGNDTAAKNILQRAKYDYAKTYNSYWIPEYEFDRMQAELEAGKKPIYFHNGIAWEYLGINGKTVFRVKI